MYKLLLCMRYLRTRFIALASIVSVMLGVATMIVVNSVMAGFTHEMRDRIHAFLADVVVEARSMDGIPDSDATMATIEAAAGEYIEAMTPTVEVPAMITFRDFAGESYTQQVHVVGIDPNSKAQVGPLRSYLDSFNEVREGDEVIRAPLRDPDAPITWELTDEAMDFRLRLKAAEAAFLPSALNADAASADGLFAESGAGQSGNAADLPEPDFFSDSADDASLQPFSPEENTDVPEESESSTGQSAETDSQSSDDSVRSMLASPDPFDELGPPPGPPEVTTDPLPARVFIGEGVVSYLSRDQMTGEHKRVMFVQPGEDIILTTVSAGAPPEPRSFSATVVDIFRSGMSEYDSQLVLMNLRELQKNRGMFVPVTGEDAITSVQIKLKDYDDAAEVVSRIQAAFPAGMVHVSTWESKQGLLLSAVEVETAILNVLLFLIIAVAGFGILAIFFMIVVEKTRDIGILKALGAGNGGVMSIFLSYGVGLGVVGSAMGVTIGLLFVRYINQIEDGLSWLTGRKVFDESIYYFSSIPTLVSPRMVFFVASGAVIIAVLASVLPARRAARLHPVQALRFE